MSRLQDVILHDIFANRPAASIAGRLFYASDTFHRYRDNGTSWDLEDSSVSSGGGLLASNNLSDVSSAGTALANLAGAPNSAHFLTSQAESGLSAEVNLGALASGLVFNTVTAGIAAFSSKVIGTDVQTHNANLDTIAAITPSNAQFLQSVSGAWAQRSGTQATANLDVFGGDIGSGGTKGLVPAPAAGDNAAGKFLKAGGGWAAPTVAPSYNDAGNSSTALTVNWATANAQKVTLTGNCTFTFSNPVSGGVYVLELLQDATGSRTVTWPGTVKWSGGTAPTLTTTASKTDIFTFFWDGTSYFGVTSGLNF